MRADPERSRPSEYGMPVEVFSTCPQSITLGGFIPMDTIANQDLVEVVTRWVLQNSPDPLGGAGSVTPETDVLASGLLDSLGLMNLVAYIESVALCRIDLQLDVDLTEFSTIRGLCGLAVQSRDGMRQGGGDE